MTEEGQCSGRIICAPHCTDYKKLLKGNVIGNVTGVTILVKWGKYFSNRFIMRIIFCGFLF